MFDRTFLPEASFEFVVFSDTHYLRNPEVTTSDADDLSRTRHWSKRAAQALKLAAALNPDFVIPPWRSNAGLSWTKRLCPVASRSPGAI